MHALTASHILIHGKWSQNTVVLIENSIIQAVTSVEDVPVGCPIENLKSGYLVPGFFDIQVNGGGGILLNDAPNITGITAVANAHQKFGTTSLLPTLITDNFDIMKRMADAIELAIHKKIPGVRGVHFEGPYLNPDRKGVHDAAQMDRDEQDFINLIQGRNLGRVLVTLAPEKVSMQFIRQLVKSGCVVSAGHTNASYEQTLQAIEAGLTGFTHLFNAMPPLLSREPGVIGAALDDHRTFSGLIADGHHVHPAALRMALRSLTAARAMLVTDAMPTVGTNKTSFRLGKLEITVKDGRCITADGTLAGSAISMADAVIYSLNNLNLSLIDVVQMASKTPALFMGLNSKIGTIAAGQAADFVHLSENGQVLGTFTNLP